MWTITKQFDFCYGHRVWSQALNAEYSLDTCLKCRHLHGHQGTILISLQSDKLQDGMVTDFKHLNWFKKWLDDYLDHKFIIDIHDPILPILFPDVVEEIAKITEHPFRVLVFGRGFTKEMPLAKQEVYEGLVFVDFVPTSENIAAFIFAFAKEKMEPLGVTVSQVQFFETPKSQSIYTNL